MITIKVKQFLFALLGIAFLASCQKDLDVQQADIDQSRIRGIGAGKLNAKAELGRKIYFDSRFSEPSGMQSCSSCHLPHMGYVGMGDMPSGPNSRGFRAGIGEGAVAGAFGGRKPPSAAYATFAPALAFATALAGITPPENGTGVSLPIVISPPSTLKFAFNGLSFKISVTRAPELFLIVGSRISGLGNDLTLYLNVPYDFDLPSLSLPVSVIDTEFPAPGVTM